MARAYLLPITLLRAHTSPLHLHVLSLSTPKLDTPLNITSSYETIPTRPAFVSSENAQNPRCFQIPTLDARSFLTLLNIARRSQLTNQYNTQNVKLKGLGPVMLY